MNKLIATFLCVVALAGCASTSLLTSIENATDVAGNVCTVILTSTDPTAAPICTTVQDIALAVESLFGTSAAVDAGTVTADTPSSVATLPPAQQQAVYDWLLAHGAKTLKAQ